MQRGGEQADVDLGGVEGGVVAVGVGGGAGGVAAGEEVWGCVSRSFCLCEGGKGGCGLGYGKEIR